jgi:Amt family ammonium transporter
MVLAATLAASSAWGQAPAATAPAAAPAAAASATAPAAAPAAAGDSVAPAPELSDLDKIKIGVDTMWVMIAGFLVFFMNLGFACVESGFCRAKNCVNILAKNFIVFAVCSLGYWLLGWGLMFGDGSTPYFGDKGLLLVQGEDNSPATGDAYKGVYSAINWTDVPLWAKFFFQLVFCGTAATIVSGAVAERIKYISFIVFSFILAVAIYPIVGHWVWGGGFLQKMGFVDFAGSTQVHSLGGWAALAGMIVLGPRLGKYNAEGKVQAIPGHNMTSATIGCLILWFGWFGFNPGSTMGIWADPAAVAEIAVTTNIAAAVATLTATATAWVLLRKPDIGMTLNGCLAGLVAITAPCAFVTAEVAALIGAVAGVLVVLSVLFFDRIHIDDPVGATSVHLANGVFGTICVGLFSHPDRIARAANPEFKPGLFYAHGNADQLITQLIGIGSVAVYVFVLTLVAWAFLKGSLGIRVSETEEMEGLDLGEHGNEAYHGFQLIRT